MIIYGTRMYGRKNSVRSHGRCVHCGKVGLQTSYEGRKWGHLYFIPIIPTGGPVRVVRECRSCDRGSHIPVAEMPGIVAAIQQTLDKVVVALGTNETEVVLKEKSQPVLAVIAANISDVYCMIGERELTQFLANIQAVSAGDALALAQAKVAEVKGETRSADARFSDLTGRSNDPIILYHAAHFYRDQGRLREATTLGERVEGLLVADLDVKQFLIDCYTASQDWTKLAIVYENCFLLSPELKGQKPLMKLYTKACKKAGRVPQA